MTQLDRDLDGLVACPSCDALHRITDVPDGSKARCRRCKTVLMAPRAGAMTQIVMLSVTALVLMVAAVFFPFLSVNVEGLRHSASVFDTIRAYSDGLLMPLSFAIAALIVVLPAVRLVAVVYTVGPMMIGHRPLPHAPHAFRIAEALKPWAMAEVFVVGVAVALAKVAGMATVSMGPAFWAFVALVLVTTLKDTFMCKLTVWRTLEERRP